MTDIANEIIAKIRQNPNKYAAALKRWNELSVTEQVRRLEEQFEKQYPGLHAHMKDVRKQMDRHDEAMKIIDACLPDIPIQTITTDKT